MIPLNWQVTSCDSHHLASYLCHTRHLTTINKRRFLFLLLFIGQRQMGPPLPWVSFAGVLYQDGRLSASLPQSPLPAAPAGAGWRLGRIRNQRNYYPPANVSG